MGYDLEAQSTTPEAAHYHPLLFPFSCVQNCRTRRFKTPFLDADPRDRRKKPFRVTALDPYETARTPVQPETDQQDTSFLCDL